MLKIPVVPGNEALTDRQSDERPLKCKFFAEGITYYPTLFQLAG